MRTEEGDTGGGATQAAQSITATHDLLMPEMQTGSGRILWLDAQKGVFILLVILGHVIQTTFPQDFHTQHLWCFTSSFRMPAFMALSGWIAYKPVQKRKLGLKDSIIRRARQLMFPYIVWSLLKFAVGGCYTLELLQGIILNPSGFYWYLWALFWIYVLYRCVQSLAAAIRCNETIVIGAVALFLLAAMTMLHTKLFGFDVIAYFFFYFFIGDCIRKYSKQFDKMFDPRSTRGRIILGVLTLYFVVAACYWKNSGLPDFASSLTGIIGTLINYAFRVSIAISAILVLMAVGSVLQNIPSAFNRMTAYIGRMTLGIYTVHILLLDLGVGLCRMLLPTASDNAVCTMAFVSISLATCVIVVLLRKIPLLTRLHIV